MYRITELIKKNKWEFESHIGFNRSWWSYYAQYRKVVEDLTHSINSGINPIDTVSLPLLFSIRHSFELGLKANILDFEKINTEVLKIKLKEHSLELLCNKFTDHLKIYKTKYSMSKEIENQMIDYLKKFLPLKDKLHQLDRGSFNFRYPVDTSGNFNFNMTDKVNLAEIINAFNEIQPFLVFTHDVLLDQQENK